MTYLDTSAALKLVLPRAESQVHRSEHVSVASLPVPLALNARSFLPGYHLGRSGIRRRAARGDTYP